MTKILTMSIHVILYNPKIPQNTGNIGRLCAITNVTLHLIHPLGFEITDRHLKRSGMDYWHDLNLIEHNNWESFLKHPQTPQRLWLLTTKSTQNYWNVQFKANDGLIFGSEDAGAPNFVHEHVGKQRITLPQFNPKLRSLNLSTAVGITVYEALRQFHIK